MRFIVIGGCDDPALMSVQENRNTVCVPSFQTLRRIMGNITKDIECRFEGTSTFQCCVPHNEYMFFLKLKSSLTSFQRRYLHT